MIIAEHYPESKKKTKPNNGEERSLKLRHRVLSKLPRGFKSLKKENTIDNPHVKSSDKLLSKLTYEEIASETAIEMSPPRSNDIVICEKDIASNNFTPEDLTKMILAGQVIMLRPSWSSLMPIILLAILSSSALFVLSLYIMVNSAYLPMQFLLVILVWCAAILHQKYNFKYFISSEGMTLVKGLIGMFIKTIRIPYDRIGEVELRR